MAKKTPPRKSWDSRLPKLAWAIVDNGKLATINAQLSVFWLRHVAKRYNDERLGGTGTIVRVEVREWT